jgi:hypothetical protein
MKATKTALEKWMKSKSQGEIVRQLPNAATTIRKYRKEVSSSTGALANILSMTIGKRSYDPKWKKKTKYCRYCRIVRGKKERNSLEHQGRCWTDARKRRELRAEMAEIVKLWEPGYGRWNQRNKLQKVTREQRGY